MGVVITKKVVVEEGGSQNVVAEAPAPTKKATKKKVVGKTKVTKHGGTLEQEVPVKIIVAEKQLANVGYSLGYTKNLGNYESARVQVTLNMPCEVDKDSVEAAMAEVTAWVDQKMEEIVKGLE